MLPIDAIRREILDATAQPGFCLLLDAPTGSGKSTRVPLLLLERDRDKEGGILVVQPRRLAARLLARYVARQYPCPLGKEVGYAVRFDSKQSPETRLLYVTDGILERRLTDDPDLRGIRTIIFDEIHERRLSSDLCLARALELQRTTRPDLGIIAMSATLETDKLQRYLPHATILRAEGRLYPVEIRYMPPIPTLDKKGYIQPPPLWEQCAAAIKQLAPHEGDILAFLPGAYEIRRTINVLEHAPWMKGRDLFPLHGQLSPEDQAKAVEQGNRPRVIVSTNIAETSLTIEGVRSVVDSGTAREARWDPARGIPTLHIVPISQAQAEQRAGRAGRLGPGRCIRLWSESEHKRRPLFPLPEILRADLSTAILHLLSWGCQGLEGIRQFPWLDPPTEQEMNRAWLQLQELGAINEQGTLTPTGKTMLAYPLPPVLARLMTTGKEQGCEAELGAIAALIQGECLALPTGLSPALRQESDFTDFQAEWRAVRLAERLHYRTAECTAHGIMARAAKEIFSIYRQLLPHAPEPDFPTHEKSIMEGLLHSYPTHVAVRNNFAQNTARLTAKRSGKIISGLPGNAPIFLATEISEIGGKGVETRLSRCTKIDRELLTPEEKGIDRYDPARKRVLHYQRLLYRDLVLEEKETGDAHPADAAPLLAEQVIRGELKLSGWDGHVLQWINRLECLRKAMPELDLPEFSDDDKMTAIAIVCEGAVSYKEIANRPILPILEEWLSGWQKECLIRYAPKTLALPNGKEIKLLYKDDGTPHFGLKCQQLFGVPQTPCIANGKIPCQIEILAPNLRPYQITRDLASFWRNGYPQMKKDLAGRYPRHHWPDTAPDA